METQSVRNDRPDEDAHIAVVELNPMYSSSSDSLSPKISKSNKSSSFSKGRDSSQSGASDIESQYRQNLTTEAAKKSNRGIITGNPLLDNSINSTSKTNGFDTGAVKVQNQTSRMVEIGCCGDRGQMKFEFIYDSIYPVFYFKRFLWQLSLHLLFPLLWFQTNNVAQGFASKKPQILFFTSFNSTCFFLLLATFPLLNNMVLQELVLIPIIVYVVHKVMISLKYATLTPKEYKRFITNTDDDLASTYRQQCEMIMGWFFKAKGVVEFALSAAALRAGCILTSPGMAFKVPNPALSHDPVDAVEQVKYWKSLMKLSATQLASYDPDKVKDDYDSNNNDDALLPGFIEMSDGSKLMCLYRTALGLIASADNKIFAEDVPMMNMAVRMMTYLYILVPIIMFIIATGSRAEDPNDDSSGQDSYGFRNFSACDYIFLLMVIIILFTFAKAVMYFAFIIVFNAKKQRTLLGALVDMLRISDQLISKSKTGTSSDSSANSATGQSRRISAVLSKRLSALPVDSKLLRRIASRRSSGLRSLSSVNVHNAAAAETKEGENADMDEEEEAEQRYYEKLDSVQLNLDTDAITDHDDPVTGVKYESGGFVERKKSGTQKVAEETAENIPRLDVFHHNNIVSWTYLRKVMILYGERFKLRFEIYVGKFVDALDIQSHMG
jgi:hypothetical protein